jgi:hypothetical protein
MGTDGAKRDVANGVVSPWAKRMTGGNRRRVGQSAFWKMLRWSFADGARVAAQVLWPGPWTSERRRKLASRLSIFYPDVPRADVWAACSDESRTADGGRQMAEAGNVCTLEAGQLRVLNRSRSGVCCGGWTAWGGLGGQSSLRDAVRCRRSPSARCRAVLWYAGVIRSIGVYLIMPSAQQRCSVLHPAHQHRYSAQSRRRRPRLTCDTLQSEPIKDHVWRFQGALRARKFACCAWNCCWAASGFVWQGTCGLHEDVDARGQLQCRNMKRRNMFAEFNPPALASAGARLRGRHQDRETRGEGGGSTCHSFARTVRAARTVWTYAVGDMVFVICMCASRVTC